MREQYRDLKGRNDLRVLVSRTDKIGDVILTLPLINEIKRLLPGSSITFLISRRLEELIAGYKDIDEIKYIEDFGGSELLSYLKVKKFDIAISAFPRYELARTYFIADIPHRAGTAYRWYSFLFNRRIKEHRKHSVKHESDYNLGLLRFLTDDISFEKKFYFSYKNEEYEVLRNLLTEKGFDINSKYIIIHPGSKGSAHDLPAEKFGEMTERFLDEFSDFRIAVTGSENERELAESLSKGNERVFNAAGLLTLRQLMIFIDKSRLFISNSTGPIHIAGALNKNIIGFYPNSAPMNPERWKPLSENSVVMCPQSGDDMKGINIESIVGEIHKFLYKRK